MARRWEQQGYSGTEAQAKHAATAWAESKPVLHLATAFNEKALPVYAGPDVVEFFYRWPGWLEPALLRAEELRQARTADNEELQTMRIAGSEATLGNACPELKLRASEMIRLLPEPGDK